MTNYYIPIIYIVPLISVDGQASPSLFIAPEIRHEKISYIIKILLKIYVDPKMLFTLFKQIPGFEK